MPDWTREQQEAIDKEGCNIIVSAGAGSGKTAVLSERVIRKLKDGVKIDEILILTFTNAATFEMKDRIRKKMLKDVSLKDQLDLLDSSYITTFDSFSLAMVKKYHYLLNIDRNISIIDSSIIYNEKIKILDEIMDRYYREKDPDFIELINDFCVKDDSDIKKYMIKLNDKMDLLMDKETFLDDYIAKYFDPSFIEKRKKEYLHNVNTKFSMVKERAHDLLSLAEKKLYIDLEPIVNKYDEANTYDDISDCLTLKLPTLAPKSADELKDAKEKLSVAIADLKKYMPFSSEEELVEKVEMTLPYNRIIVKIIKELNERIMAFKKRNNAYEFNDIAHLAIEVVQDNEEVRKSLRDSFKEIMIDEYQDTSYLQEYFISLIADDNVYMVGDIKQSIYRFRNAEPLIFKNKYDKYSLDDGGYKIDLLKNFRSRSEVLNNINLIFDAIMDDCFGGARYRESHRLSFGNNSYEDSGKTTQNYDMEVYNYELSKDVHYTSDEIEIFIIVQDIIKKVKEHYQVFDKDDKVLRDATYSDFCILLDRATKFDLYKKIFEYFGVPLTKFTSTNIKKDDEIILIKNILSLLCCLQNEDYGVDFKYNFMSIGRSYLCCYDDEQLFDYLDSDAYKTSQLYQTLMTILKDAETLSLSRIIEKIIDQFAFYMKSISVGEVEKVSIRLEYIINLAKEMEKMGFGIGEFKEYLERIIDSEEKMECDISDNIGDSVKIMTIHKSKGLEYYICYFAGFKNEFNFRDLSQRFIFQEKYGIICPYFEEGIGDTFYKIMNREENLIAEISEKIRLFYVALTRCREKMIIVCPLKDQDMSLLDGTVDTNIRNKYKSFLDIFNSISSILNPYVKKVDLEELHLTRDYNLIKKTNYKDKIVKTDELIVNYELSIPNEEVTSLHFSKNSADLLPGEVRDKMKFGTKMHYLFEMFDFKNPDFSTVDERDRKYLEKFLNSGLSFDGKIYKEYEFLYEEENIVKHGVIDLMIEYPDLIKIIDYKLKNIDDENYLKQLSGYRNYVMNKTAKKVEIYLYSIIDGKLQQLQNGGLEKEIVNS